MRCSEWLGATERRKKGLLGGERGKEWDRIRECIKETQCERRKETMAGNEWISEKGRVKSSWET